MKKVKLKWEAGDKIRARINHGGLEEYYVIKKNNPYKSTAMLYWRFGPGRSVAIHLICLSNDYWNENFVCGDNGLERAVKKAKTD
jgi:hypothetical protein